MRRSSAEEDASERGYTLIELLMAMTLSLVVIAGPLYFMIVSIRQQNAASSRTAAAHQAETGCAW